MTSAVSTSIVEECPHDLRRVALPRAEIHIAVRFGPCARGGLDVHVLGGRQRAHRKLIRSGQRIVLSRLALGAHESVLGVPASLLAGRVTPLEDLWGRAATEELVDRLAGAADGRQAADIVASAADARGAVHHPRITLVTHAARRLGEASVSRVAADLGVSDRHLRRTFHEIVGVTPKIYAKLARFRSAVRVARRMERPSWASIAVGAGYYDQAHLIAEFRAIAGATPTALLEELKCEAEP